MIVRRHACVVVVLALVSAACSGPAREGGAAAPRSPLATSPTTTTTTLAQPGGPAQGDGLAPPPTAAGGRGAGGPQRGSSTSEHGPATTTTSPRGTSATTTPTATTVPADLPPEKCPEPKTCRYYAFTTGQPVRYPSAPDGSVPIEFWVNPTGLDTSTITVEQAEGAIAAAFDTWQRAAPALRIVYRGRTDRAAVEGDGVNVVSFVGANVTIASGRDGRPEFDMQLAPRPWVWEPCEQRDGSCTPTGKSEKELQSVATHEAGHALWLSHPPDRDLHRYMTMWPGDPEQGNGRFWSTLGLGDVLGIRALYPCSCPLPPVYDP